MKSIVSVRQQRGFSFTELVITLAVIALLVLGAVQGGMALTAMAKVSKTAEGIRQIAAATTNWGGGRFNYNGASLSTLETQKLLPSGFAAAGTPFGGTYTLSGNGSRFTVTSAGFPEAGLCLQVLDKIERDTQSASCSGTTLTTTFGS